jgi:hypothetical protein
LETEPLPDLIGLACTGTCSPGDLSSRHDEYLAEDVGDYGRDTAPDIERRRLAAARNTPKARKLEMAADMSQAVRELSVAGLRHRFPDADEREIRSRLAQMLFDPETARRLCEGRLDRGVCSVV